MPAIFLLAILPSAALGSRLAAQTPGPDLVLLDSLVLEETDHDYLGQPLGLFVGADGSLLISDGFSDAVFQYDRSGRLMGIAGQKGDGPGEFRNLGGVGFAGGSVIGFVDEAGKLELYDSGTRAHLGSVRLSLENRPAVFAVRGDSLWFAGVNPRSGHVLGVVAISELSDAAMAGGGTGLMELTRGSAPQPYTVDHPLAFSLAHAFIDVGDDDVALAFTATPFILRVHHDGSVRDTAWIAMGVRRGEIAESDLLTMMEESRQPQSREELRSSTFDFYGSVSFVRGISRDDDGRIYTLHQESSRDDNANMTAVRLYVAVSDPNGSRQCGDTLIPVSGVGVPIPLLAGRTLWVLDQRIRDEATNSVATVVRRFRVDATQCMGAAR